MDSTALAALFRSDVRDEDSTTPLWSNTEVFSYMTDAQEMFCRLQGGIADSSSSLTRLAVTAGSEFVTISPRILKVRAAWRGADGHSLELLNYEDLQFGRRGSNDYGSYCGVSLDNTPGAVTALVEGMEVNKLRLVSIPSGDLQIRLVVYRMPRTPIDGPDTPLEIDEQHHRHLLHWMKHLAHQKQDAETYDKGRAAEFRQEFLLYCDQAKAERERREHKFRTVAYGGL